MRSCRLTQVSWNRFCYSSILASWIESKTRDRVPEECPWWNCKNLLILLNLGLWVNMLRDEMGGACGTSGEFPGQRSWGEAVGRVLSLKPAQLIMRWGAIFIRETPDKLWFFRRGCDADTVSKTIKWAYYFKENNRHICDKW